MVDTHPLRFGLKFSQQVHPIDVHIDVWRIADDAGFDHIWPFDHLIALGPDPAAPIFDGWTALGAMAGTTVVVQATGRDAEAAAAEVAAVLAAAD